jgi:hypothetical protein
MSVSVEKTRAWAPRRRPSVAEALDGVFFVLAGAGAVWLAWLLLTESFSWGWWQILFTVVFWVVLAYLALPRLHRILTTIYLPGYFIGRARTSDGLLGDPINLAALGSAPQLHTAMSTAGWTRADAITLASSWRIITSTVLRRSYLQAPVSPLLLFGRQQDVAYQQEVLGNPAKRHHVRFWRCPDDWLLPGGSRADWLAAGTFDRSVGFSLFTLQITHKIDADIDVERDHIVGTLTRSDAAVQVHVLEDFSTGYHSRNGGGDAIVTDGDLPVIDLRGVLAGARDAATDAATAVTASDGESDAAPGTPVKRPVPTVLGSALMLLRVFAGIAYVFSILDQWNAFVRATQVSASGLTDREARDLAIGVSIGVLAVVALAVAFYLLLAVLVFRGSNWARITAMALGAAVVVTSAVDYFNGGPQISLRADLFGLPLDILVLLALSSDRARLWARRPREAAAPVTEPRSSTRR